MAVMIYIKVNNKKQVEVVLFRKGINIFCLNFYTIYNCFVCFNCFFLMPTHNLCVYIVAYTFDLIEE